MTLPLDAPTPVPARARATETADPVPFADAASPLPRRRLERWTPWIVGLVVALPTLIGSYPPMTDLPHHEAIVGILRHFGDPTYFPPGLYTLNLGHPNQLFYLLAWILSYAVPTHVACRIVIAATQVATFGFGARLAEYLGKPRWVALLLMPLALGWTYLWGLVANLLGFAVLFAVLPAIDANVDRGTLRAALRSIGLMVLLYFAHESSMVIAAVGIGVFALGHPLDWKKTAVRVLPAVAALVIYVVHQKLVWMIATSLSTRMGTALTAPRAKFVVLPSILFGFSETMQYLTLGLATVATLAFWLPRVVGDGPRAPRDPGFAAFVHRHRFAIFALACFGAFVALPATWRGVTLLYHRFLAPAFGLGVIAAAASKARWDRAPRAVRLLATALALATPLGVLFVVWPQFQNADVCFRDLERIMPLIEKDSAVYLLEHDGVPTPERLYSASTWGGRIVAERGGRVTHGFVKSAISPAFLNVKYTWEESDQRVQYDSSELRPGHDLKRYRYVLVHSRDWKILKLAEAALAEYARPVGNRHEWLLLESKLPVAPILSGDVPLPDPPPPTFRDVMNRVFEAEVKPVLERKANAQGLTLVPPPGTRGIDDAEDAAKKP